MDVRRRDTALVTATFIAMLAAAIVVVLYSLDEVNLSTRNSPLGQTIANVTLVVGIVGALAPLLQVRRIIVTQSARDVSIVFLGLYSATYVLGAATGVVLLMPAYYVPGILGTSTSLTLLATALRVRLTYRNWDERSALRLEDAATGALVEFDPEASTPPTVLDAPDPENR